jgi:hypothetical protein
MQTLTLNNTVYTVQQIVQHFTNAQNDSTISSSTAATVKAMLAGTITTFAGVVQVTKVATAAAHKATTILKVSSSNVLISSSAETYTNAVKNSASKIAGNDAEAVNNFAAVAAKFTRHDDCAAIANSTKTNELQLVYLVFTHLSNKSKAYYINADTLQLMSKEEVATLLTASAANELLNKSKTIVNVRTGIEHSVSTRAVNMFNILSVTANKQQLVNI